MLGSYCLVTIAISEEIQKQIRPKTEDKGKQGLRASKPKVDQHGTLLKGI